MIKEKSGNVRSNLVSAPPSKTRSWVGPTAQIARECGCGRPPLLRHLWSPVFSSGPRHIPLPAVTPTFRRTGAHASCSAHSIACINLRLSASIFTLSFELLLLLLLPSLNGMDGYTKRFYDL